MEIMQKILPQIGAIDTKGLTQLSFPTSNPKSSRKIMRLRIKRSKTSKKACLSPKVRPTVQKAVNEVRRRILQKTYQKKLGRYAGKLGDPPFGRVSAPTLAKACWRWQHNQRTKPKRIVEETQSRKKTLHFPRLRKRHTNLFPIFFHLARKNLNKHNILTILQCRSNKSPIVHHVYRNSTSIFQCL